MNVAARSNAALLEEKYAEWKADPDSVEESWRTFFEGFELGMAQPAPNLSSSVSGSGGAGAVAPPSEDELAFRAKIVSLVYNFRTLGHTEASTDPLAESAPVQPLLQLDALGFAEADLDREVRTQFYRGGEVMTLRRMIELLRTTYCSKIGFEFMHIHNAEVRNWLRERIETRIDAPAPTREEKAQALEWITEPEAFEHFLHRRYVGQKRFSIEGGEGMMAALQSILEQGPELGVKEIVMGMAHRGRLSVLASFLKKPLQTLLHEFSVNYVPDLVSGDGDVKYHLGFSKRRRTKSRKNVDIYLAANPSHLEAVNAVVEGKARARQRHLNNTETRDAVLPLLIHGDAAFAGQGSVAEVLNLSQLPGYRTGGTVHIVVNNQIGFTTMPEDARSSDYCTDVAKMIEAPVLHVNGDSPLDVIFAARLALEFRQKFARDVVIDIVCYRRHGHNEGDEPAFTQPLGSRIIASHPTLATLFRNQLIEAGDLTEKAADRIRAKLDKQLEKEHEELEALSTSGQRPAKIYELEGTTAVEQPPFEFGSPTTGITKMRLRDLGAKLVELPEGFQPHRILKTRFLASRADATQTGEGYDWAHAETLAFASLLTEDIPVRLSGQDVRRGTFSHRHCVLYDNETRERYVPLRNLAAKQASFCAYNSLLSEAGVLGFDYGYSLMTPEMLLCWEAQFGDFANGAQVIIDQFIASAESKWGQPSGITLLLPHGYEGQGPEHSSARMERFLQLCAGSNLQITNLTKPSQYFHLLRRQMKRKFRIPLIQFNPKSLLRHPEAVSSEADFIGRTKFEEVLDDDQLVDKRDRVTRLVFCSGKVYYDLLKERNDKAIKNTAIIRLEQIYPFHDDLIAKITERYPRANKKWVWCQEEPLNMGAWSLVGPRLQKHTKVRLRYAGRPAAASPSTGSKAVHDREQRMVVESAFSV